MILVVSAEAFEVREPNVFSALEVRSALAIGPLAEAASALGLGIIDPDQLHVWIEPEVLRLDGDAERIRAIDGMLAYAAGRGWVDDAGRVRAHLAVRAA
ncbi:hypothetical protein [uncultured Amnibacterium sp.]|uniref:hypothetical protein n=1 Tax=uncultured Amnibacterium sp. TaxID=1631851 RepID=UPI0035CBB738